LVIAVIFLVILISIFDKPGESRRKKPSDGKAPKHPLFSGLFSWLGGGHSRQIAVVIDDETKQQIITHIKMEFELRFKKINERLDELETALLKQPDKQEQNDNSPEPTESGSAKKLIDYQNARYEKPHDEYLIDYPDSDHQTIVWSLLNPNEHDDEIINMILTMIGQGSTTGRDLCSRIEVALQQQFRDHETGLCKTYDFEFKELDGEYWFYLLYTYPATTGSSPTDGLLFIAPGVKPALNMEDYFEGVNINRDAISDCEPAIVEIDTQGNILPTNGKGLLKYDS
jgi:hypothetical protein